MTIEAVKQLHDAAPFTPFEIYLTDGRKFPVLHRDFLSLGPLGRTLIVWHPEESFDILDVRLVASLHVKSGASTNGGA